MHLAVPICFKFSNTNKPGKGTSQRHLGFEKYERTRQKEMHSTLRRIKTKTRREVGSKESNTVEPE
jgi:hypothetical protein